MVRPSHKYNLRDRKKLKDQQQAKNEENQRKAEKEEQARKQRAESRRKRREEVEESSSSSEESDSDMESAPTAASRPNRNIENKTRPPQKKRARQSDPEYNPSCGRGRKLIRDEKDDNSSDEEDKLFQGFRNQINGSKLRQFENHQVTHTLDDLQGIQEIKKKVLGALVYPFCSQAKAGILKLQPQKGLLLCGNPGTGKSRLADAIVNEIRDQGVNVNYYKESGTCLSKYVGESERNLRNLFATAEQNAPSVIFLDELDGIGGTRRLNDASSAHNTILTTLLVELNQIKPGRVVLIAATNRPENCDAALIRKGRFDLHIKVPLPNEANRREILSFYLDKIEVNLSEAMMRKLAANTEGNTGSDLESLIGELHQEAIDKLFPNGNYRNMPNRQIRERKEALLEETMDELINEKWEEEVENEEQEALDSEEKMDEESEEDESEEDLDSEEEMDEESEEDESEEEDLDSEEEMDEVSEEDESEE